MFRVLTADIPSLVSPLFSWYQRTVRGELRSLYEGKVVATVVVAASPRPRGTNSLIPYAFLSVSRV